MRILLACALVMHAAAAWPQPDERGSIDQAVSRFLSRPDNRVREYRAIRRMEASNERFNMRGWIEAETTLSQNGAWSYRILSEGGSARIRESVFLKLLEGEKEAMRGDLSKIALTEENYVFTSLGESAEEPGVARIKATPRREDKLLVDGILFTDGNGSLLRIEGRPSKNPSFWVRNVRIVRTYAHVGDMSLPTSFQSTADLIPFIGSSSLTVRYEYETVNGADVREEIPPN